MIKLEEKVIYAFKSEQEARQKIEEMKQKGFYTVYEVDKGLRNVYNCKTNKKITMYVLEFVKLSSKKYY